MVSDADDAGSPGASFARTVLVRLESVLPADDLLRHGGLLAVATTMSGGLNYAFQVFMGRALGPEEYGVFGALFALFYLLSVLGRGLRFCASRFVTELADRGESVTAFHRGLLIRALLLGTGLFLLLIVASSPVSAFLGISSPVPLVLVAATLPPGLAIRINRGSFQGLQWFNLLGSYNVLQALVKLLLGVALVLAGFGVHGALGALVIATAVTFGLMSLHLLKRLDEPVDLPTSGFDYRRAYRFMPPAVLAGLCLTIPMNVDVILVKHFFASDQAGLYTAVSVLGKVLLFLPMGISAALFPKVTSDNTDPDRDRMGDLFDRAILYSAVIAGAGAVVYWVAPVTVLGVLFGSVYAPAAPLLRWYGVAALFFVLAIVVLKFELARDRMRFVYVFAGMSVVEIVLMWFFHGSMTQIIQVLLLGNLLLLVLGVAKVKLETTQLNQ